MLLKVLLLAGLACAWAGPLNKPSGRIFNGSTAADAQFPYQAFIRITSENARDRSCSGAILSKEWIVTSASCIIGAKSATVQVGSNTITTSDPHRELAHGDRFYVPEGFEPDDKYKKDIGLIRLRTPLEYTEYISPITLGTEDLTDDVIVTTSGWGNVRAGSSQLTNYLQFTALKIISNAACKREFPNAANEDLVCAQSNTARVKAICSGDEGSPLVTGASTRPILVGIGVLSSLRCGADPTSGFTRIYNYANWIKEVTGLTF